MIIQQDNSMVVPAIEECFASDKDLVERWHVESPATLAACITRTVNDVQHFHKDSFRFFMAFSEDERLAGYWGTEHGNYINLIFVKPQHRTAEFMKNFWTAVKSTVADPFFAAIYSKNKPALSFYKKLATKMTRNGDLTIFQFNKGFTCQ